MTQLQVTFYSIKDLKVLQNFAKDSGSVVVKHSMTEYYICGSEVTSLLPSSSFATTVLPKLISTAMAHHFKEMTISTGDVEAKLAHLALYSDEYDDDDNTDPFNHFYSFVHRKCEGKAIFNKF